MSHSCQEIRDRLIERPVAEAALELHVAAHLQACDACAQVARRAASLERAFSELVRMHAPADLAGRVVAACHNGFREDRAVAALERVGRLEMPEHFEFTHLTEHDPRRAAPAELSARLDAELRDPQLGLELRFAKRLERLSAPAELEARVAATLAGVSSAGRPERVAVRRPSRALALAASVLGLALVTAWALLNRISKDAEHAPDVVLQPEIQIHVEYVDSLDDLDPFAAQLIGGLSGGVAEHERLLRAVDPAGAGNAGPQGEPR